MWLISNIKEKQIFLGLPSTSADEKPHSLHITNECQWLQNERPNFCVEVKVVWYWWNCLLSGMLSGIVPQFNHCLTSPKNERSHPCRHSRTNSSVGEDMARGTPEQEHLAELPNTAFTVRMNSLEYIRTQLPALSEIIIKRWGHSFICWTTADIAQATTPNSDSRHRLSSRCQDFYASFSM